MSAIISSCGRYRYRLERDLALTGGVCAFLMLNPSTADATKDDATIRRCRRFAADVGAARLVVGNLFAYRATDPADLYAAHLTSAAAGRSPATALADIVGPDNDQHLAAIIAEADTLIGAWGAASKCFNLVRARVPRVLDLVAAAGKALHCLRVTKNGQPEHPVRLPAALRPVPWSPR